MVFLGLSLAIMEQDILYATEGRVLKLVYRIDYLFILALPKGFLCIEAFTLHNAWKYHVI